MKMRYMLTTDGLRIVMRWSDTHPPESYSWRDGKWVQDVGRWWHSRMESNDYEDIDAERARAEVEKLGGNFDA